MACKSTAAHESASGVAFFGDEASGCQPLVEQDWIRTYRQTLENGRLSIRIGVAEPQGETHGDILFFIGFADRVDNHKPLFDAWTAAGFRVIAYDYPSHGETCGSGNVTIQHVGDAIARAARQ